MIYLQFPDEKTAKASTGWWSKGAGWAVPTPELQIAVRGIVYNNDADVDMETGEVISPATAKPGYHIDVIYGDIPTAAQQYIITPAHPDFVLA